MPFTGTWFLIDPTCGVSNWLRALNISNDSVIDNCGLISQLKHVNGSTFLEGGSIFISDDLFYRVGRTMSVLIYARK